ncbi:hypothetical protein BKI52_04625 [marine bacterium AO1-C]|nr:hypothetical protein BKI52_04625 [marine bacterium AO1-C]
MNAEHAHVGFVQQECRTSRKKVAVDINFFTFDLFAYQVNEKNDISRTLRWIVLCHLDLGIALQVLFLPEI